MFVAAVCFLSDFLGSISKLCVFVVWPIMSLLGQLIGHLMFGKRFLKCLETKSPSLCEGLCACWGMMSTLGQAVYNSWSSLSVCIETQDQPEVRD